MKKAADMRKETSSAGIEMVKELNVDKGPATRTKIGGTHPLKRREAK